MHPFLTNAWSFIKLHKMGVGIGVGSVAAVGTTMSLINRHKAAAIGEKLVEKIRSVIGVPYIYGSRDPAKGLDCSGTVVWALRELGLEPKGWNSTAADLWKQCSRVYSPVVGDLIFYGGSLLKDPSHVMIYAGADRVVGASGGGPSTTTVAKAREKNAEVKELDIDYRKDRSGMGRLPLKEVEVKDEAVGGLHMLGSV